MDLIGNTPLVDLTALVNPKVEGVQVLGKAEYLNPGFSMKDRIMMNILSTAEKEGKLKPGMTVVAASSGNTGAACAMLCAMRGYKAVIITNEKCSVEKQDSIRCYGAELMVVSAADGVDYMEEEIRLADENPDWFSVDQYNNQSNPEAHFMGTGTEIFAQCPEITHFVAAGSTGGTITGVGRYLKEQKEGVSVVMADPYGSVFYDYWKTGELHKPGKFLVEGVGKNNIPGAMDFSVVDRMERITDTESFEMCQRLATSEGILVGGSAGLNVAAAVKVANESEEPAVIVTILCDLGIKYLSKVYNEEWRSANGVPM